MRTPPPNNKQPEEEKLTKLARGPAEDEMKETGDERKEERGER